MLYHYHFCIPYQQELILLLEKENIRYKQSGALGRCFSDGTPIPVVVSFEIKDHSAMVDRIIEQFRYRPQISLSYSAAEINNADYLWITPQKQYIDLLDEETTFFDQCSWTDSRGIRRVHRREAHSPLKIAHEPSTKSQTAFWAESTGFAYIFTDDRVYKLADTYHLQGVDLDTVTLRNGSPSENIFLLNPRKQIETSRIVMGKGEREEICPICGYRQYLFDNTYQLHLAMKKTELCNDAVITAPIFGTGIPRSLYLISQRFYQALKKHKLAASIHVDPVIFDI